MKKNLLFVIDSLDCAGAEKSLVTLLNLLDFSKYSVDLMLFGYGGILEELVPQQVKILKPLKYTEFTKLNLSKAIKLSVKNLDFRMLYSRIKYSMGIRMKKYSNPEKARIFWENASTVIELNPKVYDIAISYAQGIPTFYVAEKVKAKKKYAWVNASYRLDKYNTKYQKEFYDQFYKIIAVSDSAKQVFIETFPFYEKKVEVIYDITNQSFIEKMSNLKGGYEDNFKGIRILTIGRLDHQKGYDYALQACKKLKEEGINFRWYVLGKGPLQKEIEDYILSNHLENHFILLGVKLNPYPYIQQADIYVQPSRTEGFGIAMAEARILNVPVVATRFDAVYNQIVEGKNGLVVDMNSTALYDGILKLISNTELRENIIKYLNKEKKGNIEELQKIYQLIG